MSGRKHLNDAEFAEYFWSRARKTKGCWLWTGCLNRRGQGNIRRGGNLLLVSRVAWTIMHGPIPAKMFVCHKCDVPSCINPSHLFLGTQFDNMRDCAAKGRHKHQRHPELALGENNPNAKLTNKQVAAIRKDKRPYKAIAVAYGVTHGHIINIRCGCARRNDGNSHFR